MGHAGGRKCRVWKHCVPLTSKNVLFLTGSADIACSSLSSSRKLQHFASLRFCYLSRSLICRLTIPPSRIISRSIPRSFDSQYRNILCRIFDVWSTFYFERQVVFKRSEDRFSVASTQTVPRVLMYNFKFRTIISEVRLNSRNGIMVIDFSILNVGVMWQQQLKKSSFPSFYFSLRQDWNPLKPLFQLLLRVFLWHRCVICKSHAKRLLFGVGLSSAFR